MNKPFIENKIIFVWKYKEKRRSVSYYSLVRNLVNSLYKKNNRQKRSRSHRAWAIAYLLYKLIRAPNRMRQ